MKITALAGGVGGAKLVDGLAKCLSVEDLKVIVNTGDDFVHFGLNISPDLDTICYTLADLSNETTGWGRKGEKWECMDSLKAINAPTWFNIGDRDLATHLERTRRLKNGETLTQITGELCSAWGIKHSILPMSDEAVRTMIKTKEYGWLPFQEYFVKHQFTPVMQDYRFDHIEEAKITNEGKKALEESDWIIICPSNPFVSIEPIYQLCGVKEILKKKKVLAVSPIINGKALKGPAAKMFNELGIKPSSYEVFIRYHDFLDCFVVNNGEARGINDRKHWHIMIKETNIIMEDKMGRIRLAKEILKMIEAEL